MAVHRPAFPWIFTFYGLSDLLCSVCKYEQVDEMNSLVDNFCGLQELHQYFHDEKFWKSLLTTIIYLIGIPIGMILGLLLAMGMNRKIPGIRLLRTMYYVPVVSSLVAVSILWAWVYNYDYGLFNSIIKLLTGHRQCRLAGR